MPLFHYKAASDTGHVTDGVIEAPDPNTAALKLQDQGQIPLTIEALPSGNSSPGSRTWTLFRRRKAIDSTAIDFFTLELATLLKAGLPLGEALHTLASTTDDSALAECIGRIDADVRRGRSFSQALESLDTGLFDDLYRNMVHAGESSGTLGETLERLAAFRRRQRELRQELLSILLYPAILIVLSVAAVGVLLGFVVPQFAEMFAESGQQLPLLTRIVAGTGRLISEWWWLMAVFVLVVALLARQELRTPAGRARLDRWLVRAPVGGILLAKAQTARFARTLGTLLNNGVPLVDALSLSADTVSNRHMFGALRHASRRVREGSSLTQALSEADALPPLATKLIGVGERSGRLEIMLEQVADIYDNDVKVALKRILTLAEPAIIVSIALVITIIILSVILVILESNDLAF